MLSWDLKGHLLSSVYGINRQVEADRLPLESKCQDSSCYNKLLPLLYIFFLISHKSASGLHFNSKDWLFKKTHWFPTCECKSNARNQCSLIPSSRLPFEMAIIMRVKYPNAPDFQREVSSFVNPSALPDLTIDSLSIHKLGQVQESNRNISANPPALKPKGLFVQTVPLSTFFPTICFIWWSKYPQGIVTMQKMGHLQ